MTTDTNHDRVSMGPAGNQWHYYPRERLYDLTRSSSSTASDDDDGSGTTDHDIEAALTIRTTAGPPDTRIALAPGRTALVIVDMQNFFLHPRCRDHPTGRAAVAPLLQVVANCRAAGIQTDHLAQLGPDRRRPGRAARRRGARLRPDDAAAPGGWVYEGALAGAVRRSANENDADDAADADLLCHKNRISGLVADGPLSLRHALRARPHLQTLLFAGVNTDQCVLGTLADAYNGGWDCVAVADCCATTTPHGQATTLWNVANSYGFVIDSGTFADGVRAYTVRTE
ncbi:isochorismatase [Niveomyces insectorum RCEF 264]|uniref:Isochorismatase n=1 Tax=Niveomyces insectorum RCEF 264 TaxID=1081102 RepID=A0A162KCB4_9HYPO|nr:isochorismatase [Niveomyces insectorum RCEF 264]